MDGSSRSQDIVHDSYQVVSSRLVRQQVEVNWVSVIKVIISKGEVSSSEDVEDELGSNVAVFNIIEVSDLVKVSVHNVYDDGKVSVAVADEFSSSKLNREDSVGSDSSPSLAELGVVGLCVGKISTNISVSSESSGDVRSSCSKDVSSVECVFFSVGGGSLLRIDGSRSPSDVSLSNECVWAWNVEGSSSLVDGLCSNSVSSIFSGVDKASSDSESSFSVSSSGIEVSKDDGVEVGEALLSSVGIGESSECGGQNRVLLTSSKSMENDTTDPGINSSGGWVRVHRDQKKRGSNLECGSDGVSFSSKDVQTIVLSNSQSQICLSGSISQVNASWLSTMDSSKIHSQFSVDEDPQVIISLKEESFCSQKGESGVNFSGEVEVVSGIQVVSISPSLSINWEVGLVVVDENSTTRGGLGESNGFLEWNIDSSNVSVPLGIRGGGCDGRRRSSLQ